MVHRVQRDAPTREARPASRRKVRRSSTFHSARLRDKPRREGQAARPVSCGHGGARTARGCVGAASRAARRSRGAGAPGRAERSRGPRGSRDADASGHPPEHDLAAAKPAGRRRGKRLRRLGRHRFHRNPIRLVELASGDLVSQRRTPHALRPAPATVRGAPRADPARRPHVRANLRRLEQALTAASPELRARILRLVRREIASLERGRPTREDPRRLERLRRVEELLERRQGWPAGVEAGPGGSGAVAASAGGGATRAHDPAAAAPGKQTTGVSSAPKTIRPEMREAKGPRCVPHPLRGPGGHFRARM
jgi:hypothetical protein